MRSMISAAALAALAIGSIGAAHAQYAAQPVRTAYTVEPYTPASAITIQGNGVRLRAEPFTLDTPVLSHGSTGLPLTVVGIARMPEWNWYQVILKSGQKAFIRSDYTSAPSKGAGAATPAAPFTQAPISQPPATQMAAPLPPPNRIDYGAAPAPSPAFNPPTSVSAPVSLTPAPAPVAPAPVATPRTYGPPPMSPAPIPAAPTPPALGSPISLLPTSPMPGSAPASSNSGGLSSVDPNAAPR